MKRDRGKERAGMATVLVLVLISGLAAGFVKAQSQAPSNVFFSQGQAVSHPQDPAKSRRDALHSFQQEGIVRAASAYLSPAELGQHYGLIQERILTQPQRYIQTYQIFFETPDAAGLFLITGQVTIFMDVLKRDLLALTAAPTATEAGPPSRPESHSDAAVGEEAAAGVELPDTAPGSGQELFWAVAEKWEQDWHLPADSRDPDGPFAASVFQELSDYGWSLQFPEAGTLTPDEDGTVGNGDAVARAAALGLRYVVVGRVGPQANTLGEIRIAAGLRLLHAVSGKDHGELHREMTMGEETSHEVAIELAALLVPQLDRQLRAGASEPAAASEPAGIGEATGTGEHHGGREEVATSERVAGPEEEGELVVQIQSREAYADWLAVEAKLREQAPKLQLKGLEIGPEGSRVRLTGVDGASLKSLHGTPLANGAKIQVAGLDAAGQIWRISLVKPAMSPGGHQP